MRPAALLLLALLSGAVLFSPHAATAKETHIAKKSEVPFREDSGLISAEYYISTGKYSQALEVLEGVLNRHPECADAYTYRGYTYYLLGDRKKAKADYKKAIAINPTHLGANVYLADIYLDEGNLGRAYEQMQVLRMTCGASPCEELDELEAKLDRYKKGQRGDEEDTDGNEGK